MTTSDPPVTQKWVPLFVLAIVAISLFGVGLHREMSIDAAFQLQSER
jgi:hypothetical protein